MWHCTGRECWTPLPDTHHQLSYDTWEGGGEGEGDGAKKRGGRNGERGKRGREKQVRTGRWKDRGAGREVREREGVREGGRGREKKKKQMREGN